MSRPKARSVQSKFRLFGETLSVLFIGTAYGSIQIPNRSLSPDSAVKKRSGETGWRIPALPNHHLNVFRRLSSDGPEYGKSSEQEGSREE